MKKNLKYIQNFIESKKYDSFLKFNILILKSNYLKNLIIKFI